MKLIDKIKRKWIKIRLQPIRVFCLHQTSETFDPNIYAEPDWIPLDFLKNYIQQLQAEGYKFISLAEAQAKIANDKFRIGKYAVLTADDGLKCQLELMPWLEEQHIPVTLFVNLETLDGKTCGAGVKKYFKIKDKKTEIKHAKGLYFTKDDIEYLPPMVTIGMHGITHNEVIGMTEKEFEEIIHHCMNEWEEDTHYVPFYAYTYGLHNHHTDEVLKKMQIISVLADGGVNYNDSTVIHREIFENLYKCQNKIS